MEVILCLYSALMGLRLDCCVQPWTPWYKRSRDTLEKDWRRATKMIKIKHLPYEARLGKLRLFSLEKRRLREIWSVHIWHLKGGWKECRARLFAVDHSDRCKGRNICRWLPLEHQEACFTVRMTEHWHSLARLVVESSSLEKLKSQLDMVLDTWV